MNITYIKKLPGIPADRVIVKKIIDEKIISKTYAIRIADYILDSQGRKWWKWQGQAAATEMLYRFDDVEFWAGGKHYEGFLSSHPLLNFSLRQGAASLVFDIDGWFLRSDA